MSNISRIQFASPVVRCNATFGVDENRSPDVNTQIEALDNQQKQTKLKVDECLNSLKRIEIKLAKLLSNKTKEVLFPIRNDMALKHLDDQIGDNFDEFLSTIKTILLPLGVKKNFSRILDENLAMDYNYDGVKAKKAFKSFKNINKVMYDALNHDGYTEKEYANDIKKAFKLIKLRQNKKKCLQNKK